MADQSGRPLLDAGTEMAYMVSIMNNGNSGIKDVVLTDEMPDEVTFLSVVTSKGGCGEVSGVLTCELGNFGGQDSATVEYTVFVEPSTVAGQIVNRAFVRGDDINPSEVFQTTVVIPEADLALIKTVNSNRVTAGERLTYTLTVKNNGPADAQAVNINDTLPPEVNYRSSSSGCGANGILVICGLGTLSVDETTQLTITVDVNTETNGIILNSATVGTQSVDPDFDNNTAIATTRIVAEDNVFKSFLPFIGKQQQVSGDTCAMAVSIGPNADYDFLPEDRDDWYQFDLIRGGTLAVSLSEFVPLAGQLTVYRGANCDARDVLGMDGSTALNKVVDLGTQPAGHYYIYVSNDADPSNIPYTLRVNFTGSS